VILCIFCEKLNRSTDVAAIQRIMVTADDGRVPGGEICVFDQLLSRLD
jgi:hypothetical protein